MTGQWTPAEVAAYDQYLAGANAEIDLLATAIQIGVSEVGERQAMASMTVLINQREYAELAGLLVAALLRISEGGPAGTAETTTPEETGR